MTIVEQQPAPPVEAAATGAVETPRRPVPWPYRPLLAALLIVTTVKQLVLALLYPPFQGHDEVAHLAYLWFFATQHRLPTFSDAIPDALSPYASFTLDWPSIYTANHPPLYYLLSWPAYELADNYWQAKLYAVRLVSIPLFLITIWLCYRLALALAPDEPLLVLGVPAVIAFQPQLSFEGAIVNNDMLAIMMGTLLLYLCVLTVRQGLTVRRALALGFTVGLGLLSKATLTALVPLVAGASVYACWPRPWARVHAGAYWRPVLLRAGVMIAPAVLLPLPWYLFLHHTYGDFTAFRATQELQANWNHPAGTFMGLLTSLHFHLERLRESWGEFGWKRIPLGNTRLGLALGALLLAAFGLLVGLLRLAGRWRHGTLQLDESQAVAVGLLVAAVLLLYGAMIYFGTMFLLTQARYIFPIFPAAATLGLLGLRALVPDGWQTRALALVIALAAVFYLSIFVGQVLPYAVL